MTTASPEQPQPPSSQAVTSLVLGLVSYVTCCLFVAPVAWYFGRQELTAIREGRSPASGEGLAQAGMILGIIGTILLAMALFWIFLFGGLAVLSAMVSAAANR